MPLKEQVEASFVPPRSWRAWRVQMLQGLVVGIVVVLLLLAFTGLELDDTGYWGFVAVWLPVAVLVSAAGTAWRIRRDRR
ncbi:MAG TPA: hypothetical protein VFR56_07420 [Actinomycetes bacterium]|nr:hypothetical protein [Actinomycetes bacterium]